MFTNWESIKRFLFAFDDTNPLQYRISVKKKNKSGKNISGLSQCVVDVLAKEKNSSLGLYCILVNSKTILLPGPMTFTHPLSSALN